MIRTIIAILVFLILQICSKAQDYRDLDSLEKELVRYTSSKQELNNNSVTLRDTTQVKILNELSKVYWFNDFDKATSFAQQSINLAKNINYKKGLIDGYFCLSIINQNEGNCLLANEYNNIIMPLAEEIKYDHMIIDIYQASGFNVYVLGDLSGAQELAHKALQLSEKIQDREGISNAYGLLGVINGSLANFEAEEKYYAKSLAIAQEIGLLLGISSNNFCLGLVYLNKGEMDRSLVHLKESLRLNKEIGNKLWEAYSFDALGNLYETIGDHKLGLKHSLQSAKLLIQLGEKIKLSSTLNNIGWMYLGLGDYKNSRINLEKSLDLGLENSFIEMIAATYESLVTLDSLEGKWKQAYEHHIKFISYRDSLNNIESAKRTTEAAMKFEFDKKQLSDSLRFVKEKEIGEIKLKEQKAITYGGLIVILLTIYLIFFLYRNFRKQQEANRLLKEAQEQLIRSEKLAAFGIMASRVAHEIQNPLNFVNNFSEISKDLASELIISTDETERKETSAILIDNLQRINEHGKRAADIVKKLQEHTIKGTAHEFFEKD